MLQFVFFNLCSDFVKFHHEVNIIKSILYKNSYSRDFVDKCIKEFFNRVLTREVVVSTVPKKDLMIVLPYLGKLLLQICTRINRVMKINSPTAIFELHSRLSATWSVFSHSKIKFLFSYVLALFIHLSAVAAMLPIMAKLRAILKSECVNTLELLLSLEREWKGITILP